METYRKKRRAAHGPSKNELRASRGENEEKRRANAGTLRERFPRVKRLELDLRFEAISGATLDHTRRLIGATEPLLLNAACPGGCGAGEFLLTDAVESMLRAGVEKKEGLAICQATSYADSRTPCGTKLHFCITIDYDVPQEPLKS